MLPQKLRFVASSVLAFWWLNHFFRSEFDSAQTSYEIEKLRLKSETCVWTAETPNQTDTPFWRLPKLPRAEETTMEVNLGQYIVNSETLLLIDIGFLQISTI